MRVERTAPMYTPATCEQCGAFFMAWSYDVRHNRGRFCTKTCASTARRGPKGPLADRFWAKVDKNGPIPERCPELGPCWPWTAYCDGNGRGRVGVDGRADKASRVSWHLTFGEIPDGMSVLHKCDNPPCVRPDHLFLGTQTENMRDMVVKQRNAFGVRNGRAKLNEAAVRHIRSVMGELAQRYGVTVGAVAGVGARHKWKHVL